MDHLTTEEERKDRWYCRSIWPRFLLVKISQFPHDDMLAPLDAKPSFVHGVSFTSLLNDDTATSTGIAMRQFFKTNGFLVVSSVLNSVDCEHCLALARAWTLAASSAEARLENTSHHQKLRSVEGGILPFYGSGHSSFAWYIRSNPHVRKVFECLFGTDDLLASLDGVILWKEPPSDYGWFHVDQNPSAKPEAVSIQGLVNLIDVNEHTGGNALVLGSHQLFPEHYTHGKHGFYRQRLQELNEEDWMEIDPNDDIALCPDQVVSLCLKAGDMLLWDSRMIHCSYPPKHTPSPIDTIERGLFLRAASLVSMMPREKVSQNTIERRRRAVDSKQTLTHWVDKSAELGAERPKDAERDLKIIELMRPGQEDSDCCPVLLDWANLTREQKQLVCGQMI